VQLPGEVEAPSEVHQWPKHQEDQDEQMVDHHHHEAVPLGCWVELVHLREAFVVQVVGWRQQPQPAMDEQMKVVQPKVLVLHALAVLVAAVAEVEQQGKVQVHPINVVRRRLVVFAAVRSPQLAATDADLHSDWYCRLVLVVLIVDHETMVEDQGESLDRLPVWSVLTTVHGHGEEVLHSHSHLHSHGEVGGVEEDDLDRQTVQ